MTKLGTARHYVGGILFSRGGKFGLLVLALIGLQFWGHGNYKPLNWLAAVQSKINGSASSAKQEGDAAAADHAFTRHKHEMVECNFSNPDDVRYLQDSISHERVLFRQVADSARDRRVYRDCYWKAATMWLGKSGDMTASSEKAIDEPIPAETTQVTTATPTPTVSKVKSPSRKLSLEERFPDMRQLSKREIDSIWKSRGAR